MDSCQVKFAEFDNVRVVENEHTLGAGIANQEGVLHGWTTPSVTALPAVGPLREDFAWNVYIESLGQDFWLDPSFITFVSRPESIRMTIGGETITYKSDMTLEYVNENRRPWWKFWK
jgi:hypothetical protein